LIQSHDFVEYLTKEIRTAFGIEAEPGTETKAKSHRMLQVMFRRLSITDLTGDKFWAAFWDPSSHADALSVPGHYYLWVGDVQHTNISVKI
jgi:hypothetical protein